MPNDFQCKIGNIIGVVLNVAGFGLTLGQVNQWLGIGLWIVGLALILWFYPQDRE